jgi:hypothetical protein
MFSFVLLPKEIDLRVQSYFPVHTTLPVSKLFPGDSCGHSTDGLEHVRARVSLSKKGRATRGFCCGAGRGIIVRGHEDERGVPTLDRESVRQLDAGHTSEFDVEDEAIEPRLLRIRQKFLCRGIHDRLEASGPQETAKRLAELFVIIDYGYINGFGAAHREDERHRNHRREMPATVL